MVIVSEAVASMEKSHIWETIQCDLERKNIVSFLYLSIIVIQVCTG